jgi:hypothetical protein
MVEGGFAAMLYVTLTIPGTSRIILNKVGLFHLFKWLLGLILETKTEKIAEMLAINNGNITHFGKARAIL